GFFLLLTVQLYWPAVISGLIAIASIFRWVWSLDLPMKQPDADIGAGIRVPTYRSGPGSHGWWAMVVLLVVLGMIFGMLVFSYLYMWSQRTHLFLPVEDTTVLTWGTLVLVGAFIAAAAAWLLRGRSPAGAVVAILIAAGLIVSASLMDGTGW